MGKYHYYFRKFVSPGIYEDAVDIEQTFVGSSVLQVTGLDDRGKIKNIYKEEYAEDSRPRIYLPDKIARETTEVVITVAFSGVNRRDVYHQFTDFISGNIVKYYDSVRGREADLLLSDAVKIDDEQLIGSTPNFVVSYKFENIDGESKKHIS